MKIKMRKANFHLSAKILVFISLFCCLFVVNVHGAMRTLEVSLNPNWDINDDSRTLFYVKANGPNDTLHYIWNFNRQPSVLVALTQLNANVTFKWNKKTKDTEQLTFSEEPKYTMSFVLTKIFVFNDQKDGGTIIGVNASDIHTIDTKEVEWIREEYNSSSNEAFINVIGQNDKLLGELGTINLKMKFFGSEDHDTDIPHLLHSVNVTQMDIEFVNLTAINSSRIAIEMALIANETKTRPFTISVRKTLNDEHTPGTFKLIDIVSPIDGANGTLGSYVQFRPISYTKEIRDYSSITGVNWNQPINIEDPKSYLKNSIAWSFYGNELDKILVQSVNVSFGSPKDGFYSRTNYQSWTIVLGYGTAPPEEVSIIVVIIACIGIGLPLILLCVGGVYLAIKRMRNC